MTILLENKTISLEGFEYPSDINAKTLEDIENFLKEHPRPKDWVLPPNVRFTLGIDLDNVCADYDDAFRRHVAKTFGVPASTLGPVDSWDFSKVGWGIKDRAHFEELHLGAVKAGMFKNMKAIKGASEGLKRLSKAGIDNRIVTHRLFIKGLHGKSAGDTVKWLDKKEIPYSSLCMVEQKAEIGADLFFDDAMHNITNLRKAGKVAATFNQLYNTELPGLRVNGWDEAVELTLNLAYIKSLTETS